MATLAEGVRAIENPFKQEIPTYILPSACF